MVFKNYLTTPSGRYCEIEELPNKVYFILVKYLQAQDYKKFFSVLNESIKKDINDFDDFDIVDKVYIYIAQCMYSIRGTLEVNNKQLGSQEVQLGLILNNIESSYPLNKTVDYKLSDNFVLNFGYPKNFVFDGEMPLIDYYSGLIGFNGKVLNDEEKKQLKQKLGTKHETFIESHLRQNFEVDFDLLHGVPMNSLKMNLFGESMIVNVISFYRMPLDSYYQLMYAVIKHLRMSYSDFMNISQVEATILLKHVAEENKALSEGAKKGDITTIGRAMNDEF